MPTQDGWVDRTLGRSPGLVVIKERLGTLRVSLVVTKRSQFEVDLCTLLQATDRQDGAGVGYVSGIPSRDRSMLCLFYLVEPVHYFDLSHT